MCSVQCAICSVQPLPSQHSLSVLERMKCSQNKAAQNIHRWCLNKVCKMVSSLFLLRPSQSEHSREIIVWQMAELACGRMGMWLCQCATVCHSEHSVAHWGTVWHSGRSVAQCAAKWHSVPHWNPQWTDWAQCGRGNGYVADARLGSLRSTPTLPLLYQLWWWCLRWWCSPPLPTPIRLKSVRS